MNRPGHLGPEMAVLVAGSVAPFPNQSDVLRLLWGMSDKRDSQPTVGMRPTSGKTGPAEKSDKTQGLEEHQIPTLKEEEQATNDSLEGTLLAERYAVETELGAGGMGAVYLAQHVDLQKKVAIKVLHREYASKPELVQRFLQEAQAASRIRHDNVIDITDFGRTPSGLAFFVMEYLDGKDLAHALKKERLPWIRSEWIFMQVCDALRAAHSQGIIHRDLKPANIFLLDRGGPDTVKLLDFGIAKLTDSAETGDKLTRTGTLFGTPQYMAPEQAAGRAVDTRTDVYAMGCILFELLTGNVPFEGENFMQTLQMHLNDELPDLTEAVAGCGAPAALSAIVHRALAKRPEQRFQTIDELLDTIMAVSMTDPAPVLRSGRAITAPYDFSQDEDSKSEIKESERATNIDAPIHKTERATGVLDAEDAPPQESAETSLAAESIATPAPAEITKTAPKWTWAVAVLGLALGALLLVLGLNQRQSTQDTTGTAAISSEESEASESQEEPATAPELVPDPPPAATEELLIDTRPAGATVLHAESTFLTPVSLNIPVGESWRIRIEKQGYLPVSMNTVPGQPKLVVELSPIIELGAPDVGKPKLVDKKPKLKVPVKSKPVTQPKSKPDTRPNTDNPDPWDD